MRPIHPVLTWLLVLGLAWPAPAHKIERSGNVAGTWHLEPNHSPRAGEPARVWVALTQSGGTAIPLEQCDCQLVVYDANRPQAGAILIPTLQALSPEAFRGIPGADLTFPRVGEYRLVLTGNPKVPGHFTPFQLSYTTVVAAGSRAARSSPPPGEPPGAPAAPDALGEAQPPPSDFSRGPWAIATGMTLTLIALGLGQRWQRVRTRQSRQILRPKPKHSRDHGDRPG